MSELEIIGEISNLIEIEAVITSESEIIAEINSGAEIIVEIMGVGNTGVSAYETWLSIGNMGTEQDFINSLASAGYVHPLTHPASMIVESSDKVFLNSEQKNFLLNSQTYTHTQIVATNTWEINHPLQKFPSVTIVDSAGSLVEGDVQFISDSKVIVSFTAEFSGKAYLN
jgi:hypothetical protein